jgi:hypothetical protein
MTSQFEHLELPKTSIELPRRSKGGGFGSRRSDRSSHGRQLLEQVSILTENSKQRTSPFRLNPKLIFKIKLSRDSTLSENQLTPMGLTLLAQEPNANKAIVVFSSDEELADFRHRLEAYSGISDAKYEYGYLDAIEELVPLEPQDRIGRLLELEPVQPGELAALDLELWHTGDKTEMREYIDNLDEVLRSLSDQVDMRVSDRYIGDYICLARIKVTDEVLALLLNEEFVKEIDRRPKPNFEKPSDYNIPLSTLPEVISPNEQNCGVLVIDSGVQRGHPLIAPALGDAEVFPDPDNLFITGGADDVNGHGTGVSGIAIYGDISESIRARSFQSNVWLFSARVTNSNNEYDPDLLLENQLGKAIDYFTRNYPNCKVINISLGDSRLIFREGQKQFTLAAKIDEIAYEYQHKNLVFVISSGNYAYENEENSNELYLRDYPNYLLSENARIIEPATSAIALTVGALSLGTGSLQFPDDAQRNAVAKLRGYPSPFTRSGFGVDGMIKPDLVDFGGDLVIDGQRMIDAEPGVAILTLAKDYTGSLFRPYCGTSFAAPHVANIAAQLFTQFPNATSNLIRALMVNSAILPAEIPASLQGNKSDRFKARLQIYGYGQPDLLRSQYSAENYVVLLVDNEQIPVGSFHIYEIPPLPNNFLETQGTKILSITLAFDPPTKPTRGDSYLGVTMEFNLFKNIDRDSLVSAFVNASKTAPNDQFTETSLTNLKRQHGSGISVDLLPKANLRKKGTVQRGQIEISSKATGYNENPLYVVVSCNRKWAKEGEVDMQRYSLVVSIEHSNPQVDLYNQLKIRIPISQRIRIR